ncbi:hypothetical protein SUDANB108_05383 [Streptomyces sp. enrichment culture]|uniref:hypothetical protein n=1 Tax=Streptomyces sp. enrichment culture TaxID=1795815 RepID=UPI003F570872
MKRLEGKAALISGTARGQGRAAALRFAAEGALVIGGDLLHEEAVETQRLIAREGGTALTPGPLDVTDDGLTLMETPRHHRRGHHGPHGRAGTPGRSQGGMLGQSPFAAGSKTATHST